MYPKNVIKYHYKVGFPDNLYDMLVEFINQLTTDNLIYTDHARKERFSDKRTRKAIPLITRTDLLFPDNTLIEYHVDTDHNRIQKIVIRVHHLNDDLDFTYVVSREGVVVSNWANHKEDEHTLVNSKNIYVQPKQQVA